MNLKRVLFSIAGFAVLLVVVIALQNLGLSERGFHILLMVGTAAAVASICLFSSFAKKMQRRAPVTRGSRIWVCRNAGIGLAGLGVVVAVGNRTGAMPTIPFAGAALFIVGAGLIGYSLAAVAQQGIQRDGPTSGGPAR